MNEEKIKLRTTTCYAARSGVSDVGGALAMWDGRQLGVEEVSVRISCSRIMKDVVQHDDAVVDHKCLNGFEHRNRTSRRP